LFECIRTSGIFVKNPPDTIQIWLETQLTIQTTDYNGQLQTHVFYQTVSGGIWIPRHFPIELYGHVVNKFIPWTQINIQSNIQPRNETQAKAIDFLTYDSSDVVLQLPPGSGKTVISIAALAKLKRKALVIVDQVDLAEQWCDEINRFTNLNIQPDKSASFQYPINVVTIQKLLYDIKQNHIDFWNRIKQSQIGVVVLDEVHVLIGPEQFTKVAYLLPIEKWISLSATPYRVDESGKILQYWIGKNQFQAPRKFDVKVEVVCFDSDLPSKTWKYINWGQDFSRQRYLKMLAAKSTAYIQTLISVVEELLSQNRNVLVLIERTDIIEQLAEKLSQHNPVLYYGSKSKPRDVCRLILATYAKCSKAIDLPWIDTLVYGTPISNPVLLEQTKGRIQREYPNKHSPLIIDLVDIATYTTALMYSFRKRYRYYTENNFSIHFRNNCQLLQQFLGVHV